LSDATLVGKVVWVEPDKERSAVPFSPRKGIIVRAIAKFPEKNAVFIELVPSALVWHPFPRKLTHVLLRYPNNDDDTIERTFRVGLSVAEVYRPRRKIAMREKVPEERDILRLGIAIVRPWPLPSSVDVREWISADRQRDTRS